MGWAGAAVDRHITNDTLGTIDPAGYGCRIILGSIAARNDR